MTERPPDDPLLALLEAHWSPAPTDESAFAHELERKLHRREQRRWAIGTSALLAIAATIAFFGLRAPSRSPRPALPWIAHTSAAASSDLPLPGEYAAIERLILRGRDK